MKIEWKTCFKISITVFLLYLAMTYWNTAVKFITAFISASMPLIIGCIIAYIVNILMSFYERIYFPKSKNKFINKSRRIVCISGAYVTFASVLVVIVLLIIPQLGSCIQLIFSEIPDVLEILSKFVAKLNIVPEDIMQTLSTVDWESRIGEIVNIVISGIGNVTDILIKTVSSVFSGIVTVFVAIIFSFYLLFSKHKLSEQITKLMKRKLKETQYNKTMYVLGVVNGCFRRYIVGQCTEAVILGVLCTLGMILLGFPYATMIGTVIGFTAIIPIAGAYIGAGIGAFMILTVSPMQAVLFIVFIIVLQQIEGNLIYPKVVGSSMGLPGIWVLAAITIGGSLGGIMGMLIGVPLASAVYKLLKEYTYNVKKD